MSTAKALALAMAQGQRIYTLTAENASELNNITIDDGSRTEIQLALVNGLEVTVHQAPITVNGWKGSGYSIIDADYGVGAYKISGGSSGGFSDWVVAAVITLFGYTLLPFGSALFFGGLGLGVALLAAVAALNFFLWVRGIQLAQDSQDFNSNNLTAVFGLAGGYVLLGLGLGLSVVPLLIFYEGFLLALSAL